MRSPARHVVPVAVGITTAALVGPVAPATAAACTGGVRYASSSNTIYLTAGEKDLSDLPKTCPSAPLRQVDSATRTWQLDANLVVQNGAVLHIRGTKAGKPGLVNTLRLASPADSKREHVAAITAQYGSVTIESAKVTSWDPAKNGPDTDPDLPDGAPDGSRARAFIRAISFLDPATGAPRQSRLDIVNSDLGYLGWYDAESYGVAYKARGCDAKHLDVCAKLKVLGSQRNSRFHHNFMGTYTFGAQNMIFDRNEYHNNVLYGLDPHDDSDHLTITRNHFHHNGGHGLICSQRCDHLRIANNESDHNGLTPYVLDKNELPNPRVDGMMIHRGVTNSVIENNKIHDHPNGAGIAVFDSMNNTIRRNVLTNNRFGMRIMVGSYGLNVQGNTITKSRDYGLYLYDGKDPVMYGIKSGRPTGNTFTRNTLDTSGQALARISHSDRTRFVDNKVIGGSGKILQDSSSGTTWQGRTLPASGSATVGAADTPL